MAYEITSEFDLSAVGFTGVLAAVDTFLAIPLPKLKESTGRVTDIRIRQGAGTVTQVDVGVTKGRVSWAASPTSPVVATPKEDYAYYDQAAAFAAASATELAYDGGPAVPLTGGFSAGDKWLFIRVRANGVGTAITAGKIEVVASCDVP